MSHGPEAAAWAVLDVAAAPASAPATSTTAAPARARIASRGPRASGSAPVEAWSCAPAGLFRRRTDANSRRTALPQRSLTRLVLDVPIRSPYRVDAGRRQLLALTVRGT